MADRMLLYDQHEQTDTRYVGFVGDSGRFDLMIVTTDHFYGKKVVICLQTNRVAVLNENEAANAGYLAEAFALSSEAEARELSEFLRAAI